MRLFKLTRYMVPAWREGTLLIDGEPAGLLRTQEERVLEVLSRGWVVEVDGIFCDVCSFMVRGKYRL